MKNLDEFQEKYPDLYAAIFERGKESGIRTGEYIAESRFSKKEASDQTDKNLLIEDRAKAAWDKDPDLRYEFVDSFDVFLAFVKADEVGRAKIAGRTSQEGKKDTQAAINSTDENLPIGDRAKATWDKDPDLRFEFVDNFDAYLAYVKADATGQVKIVKKTTRRGTE
jgi:hypothetical protein